MNRETINSNEELVKTLVIPLWAKAIESEKENPIIRDEKSQEIIKELDYDLSYLKNAWMSQLGIAIRSKILREQIGLFIKNNPNANVINLGCGLDTSFSHLDNGKINWYDLDFKEVIDLRKEVFESEKRNIMIASSVFDYSWLNKIEQKENPTLVIAEGLLFYLEMDQVKELLNKTVDYFPNVTFLLELVGPVMVGRAKYNDSISRINHNDNIPEFKWSLWNSRGFEKWNKSLKLEKEWFFADYYKERWRHFKYFFKIPLFKRIFSSRLVYLEKRAG